MPYSVLPVFTSIRMSWRQDMIKRMLSPKSWHQGIQILLKTGSTVTSTATGRKEIEKRRAASGLLIGGFSVLEPIDLPCFRLLISTFSDFFYW